MAAAAEDHSLKRCSSFEFLPPNLSELRLVLLGKDSVVKLLLGKTEFRRSNQHSKCVKVSGTFKDKRLTVIYTPDRLTNISLQELDQFKEEIKALSAPGPHVFLLVLQPGDFTEQHKTRLESVLESFSEQAFHRSLVLMFRPQAGTPKSMEKYMSEPRIRDMISRCRYRCLRMDHTDVLDVNLREFKRKELFSRISDMLKDLSPDLSEEEDSGLTLAFSTKEKPSLNLVLFGRSGAGKTSAAESIFWRAEPPAASSPGQCVKHQGEVCGRRVSLVELPALSGKPLEAVMQQCLRCISLCAPEGVHAFILVLPPGPLTDEDKDELELLKNTLGARVRGFIVVLFFMESDAAARESDMEELEELRQSCGVEYFVLYCRGQKQVSELIDDLYKFKMNNVTHSYTTESLVQAHIEKISQLQTESKETYNPHSPNSLRIAVIGKTGNGKSSSGNTILGKRLFETKPSQKSITKVCEKAQAEVDGRTVYVVDTPGLFDTTMSSNEVNEEMLRCVGLLAPGPHVFLLVLQIGRFTPEEKKTLQLIKEEFGKNAEKYTVILFTHGDKLVNDGIQIIQYIERYCDDFVKELISKCGNKYHVFNNTDKHKLTQVKELMNMIDDKVKENEGSCYSTEMLLEAKMGMNKDLKRKLEEKEEKIKELEEEVKVLEDEIKEKEDMVENLKHENEKLK